MRPSVKNKKLLLFSLAVLVVAGALTVATTLFASVFTELELLSRYIESLPSIVDERSSKMEDQYQAFYEDGAVRGVLCAILYSQNDELDEDERLQLAKDGVSALDVLVVDNEGNISAVAEGPQALEPDVPGISKLYGQAALKQALQSETGLFDPNLEFEGEEPTENESSAYESEELDEEKPSLPLVIRVPLNNDDRSVLALFDYAAMGDALVSYGSWNVVLERLLSGLAGYAFYVEDDGIVGYPLDGLAQSEKDQLEKDLRDELANESSLFPMSLDGGLRASYGAIALLGEANLTVALQMPSIDPHARVVVAIPVRNFMTSVLLCDVVLIALFACGQGLFVRFARKTMRQSHLGEADPATRTKVLRRHTRAGLAVVCGVTAVVCIMLFMLEGMATTAHTAMAQREVIEFESDYGTAQQRATMDEYAARHVARANALARLLSTNPQLRTREDLVRLNEVVGADYLMLFDKNGRELFSSNSYTGFAITAGEDSPTAAFLPVLNGYSYVETKPAKNEVTGKYEHAVASLVTNEQGLPDGVLLLAVNDDAIMSHMRDVSLEGTVSSFATQQGEVAAVVNDKDGLFAAHTDATKVGEPASDYLDASVMGRDYEGFAWYDGEYVYVSGAYGDNKTTMVIAQSAASGMALAESCILVALYLLVFCALFFPVAMRLCAKEEPDVAQPSKKRQRPMLIFFKGYVVFVAGLACFAFVTSRFLDWRGFDFVFGQRWTRGIHLFSLWTALFVFSVALTVVFGIRMLLERAEERVGAQTRTFVRLADSLLTYATVILLCMYILALFGVDTTTMLASAGIASIAVGMGAKDLITDILAGLFIIFEGSIRVGDIVQIGHWRGVVTDMGVRTTEITNESNDVMIITNSRIYEVVNMSRAMTLCSEEFHMPRTVDVDQVPAIVEGYVAQVAERIPELRGSLAFEGVTEVTERDYTVRVSYSCNEADREALTFRLRTTMQLLLEGNE